MSPSAPTAMLSRTWVPPHSRGLHGRQVQLQPKRSPNTDPSWVSTSATHWTTVLVHSIRLCHVSSSQGPEHVGAKAVLHSRPSPTSGPVVRAYQEEEKPWHSNHRVRDQPPVGEGHSRHSAISNTLAEAAAFCKNAFQNSVRRGETGPQAIGAWVCVVTRLPITAQPEMRRELLHPHQQSTGLPGTENPHASQEWWGGSAKTTKEGVCGWSS